MVTRIPWRGVVLDQASIDALLRTEMLLGYRLSFPQGSWSTGVAASAGTHAGGGAVDVHITGMPEAQQAWIVWALDQAGFADWRRRPDQASPDSPWPYHVHGILRGDPLVSPAAASQLVQWRAGTNGLADHGPDDDPVDVAARRIPAIPPGALMTSSTAVRRAAVHAAYLLPPTPAMIEATAQPLVLDIAWSRPPLASIVATGALGVVRYSSPDASKNWQSGEVAAYTGAGIGCATVAESTAGRATQGRAAGVADAQLAVAQDAANGFPVDHPIHFAVDSDVSWASVQAYFAGAASVLGMRRTGCYGSFRVVEGAAAFGLHYLWQTLAWSGGQVSSHATLYQSGGTLLSGAADINHVLAADGDWGQYGGVNMAVTDADAALIAAAVWNHAELNAVSPNDPVRMGAIMRYADARQLEIRKGFTDTLSNIGVVAGAVGGLEVQATEIATAIAAIAVPAITDAQIAALAAALGPGLGAAVADVLSVRLAG